MKKGDVLCAALTEITGYPKQLVDDCIAVWKDNFAGPHELDDAIAEPAAEALRADLLQNKTAIKDWLLKAGL